MYTIYHVRQIRAYILDSKTVVINYLTKCEKTPKKYSQTKTHSVVFSTLNEYPDVLDVYQAATLAVVRYDFAHCLD